MSERDTLPKSALPSAQGRRLAEFIHRETWLSHGLPPEAMCGYCDTLAARLIAAGVILAAIPAPSEGLRDALKEIAFMGSDCPAPVSPESFYREQLYACIGIAARALRAKDEP